MTISIGLRPACGTAAGLTRTCARSMVPQPPRSAHPPRACPSRQGQSTWCEAASRRAPAALQRRKGCGSRPQPRAVLPPQRSAPGHGGCRCWCHCYCRPPAAACPVRTHPAALDPRPEEPCRGSNVMNVPRPDSCWRCCCCGCQEAQLPAEQPEGAGHVPPASAQWRRRARGRHPSGWSDSVQPEPEASHRRHWSWLPTRLCGRRGPALARPKASEARGDQPHAMDLHALSQQVAHAHGWLGHQETATRA